MVGMSAQDVNLELHRLGFLKDCPGDWSPTDEGEKYLVEINKFTGYANTAGKGWTFLEWYDFIVKMIDTNGKCK